MHEVAKAGLSFEELRQTSIAEEEEEAHFVMSKQIKGEKKGFWIRDRQKKKKKKKKQGRWVEKMTVFILTDYSQGSRRKKERKEERKKERKIEQALLV